MGRKIDEFVKSQKINLLSFRRRPESSEFSMFWMPVEVPAFSGDQVRHDEIRLFTRPSKLKVRYLKIGVRIYFPDLDCDAAVQLLVGAVKLLFEKFQ